MIMSALTTASAETVLGLRASDGAAPSGLQALRATALERVRKTGLPARKHEAWKYMRLESFWAQSYVKPSSRKVPDFIAARHVASNCLFFVNGFYRPEISRLHRVPPGFEAGVISDADQTLFPAFSAAMERALDCEQNVFAAANTAGFEEAFCIRLAKGVVLEDPLYMIHVSLPGEAATAVFHPRIVILLEPGARANIVMDFVDGAPGPYFMNALVEAHAGPAAVLQSSVIQSQGAQSLQFINQRGFLSREASWDAVSFVQGGFSRSETKVRFEEPRARAAFYGLSLLSEKAQAFHHLEADHMAEDCVSRQVYKNILSGSAQAEFTSLVHVFEGAKGSDSEQLDRNLLLSPAARVYSRPQLKIEADEVKASHGAATGQLEKDELFYLQSRGLSRELARYVLIYGFAEEILRKIPDVCVRRQLEELAMSEIRTMMGGPEASWLREV